MRVDFNQFQLIGRSVAGVETVVAIPQWDITFDTGRAPDFAFHLRHLALSHWHLDHAGGLSFYLGLRRLNSLDPLRIIVPDDKLEKTKNYLRGLSEVSDTDISYELRRASEPLLLRKDLELSRLSSFHGVSSAGYLIRQTKSRLNDEFLGKSEEEISRASMAGVKVSHAVTIPLLAYSGDTTGEFLTTEASQARHLLMECSFFGDNVDYDSVRAYGHTHIDDWRRHAEAIQSDTVVMIHTSQRYSKKEIEASCKKELPKHLLDRLIVFR